VSSAAETGNAVLVIGPDDMILTSQSGSGYIYQYNKSFATVQIFESGALTPSGTISAPTITTLVNASTANPVAVTGGALTSTTGETGVTGVQAPTFTGAANAAGPFAELAAGALPSGVLADIINWVGTYAKA
jgi:hypothetical protein